MSETQVIRMQSSEMFAFYWFIMGISSEISSIGCKQRINITNDKPVGFICKVNHKVVADKMRPISASTR